MRNIKDIKRIIIKIGSSSLCDESGHIQKEKILKIVEQIAYLKRSGYVVVLVSSGAIATGMGVLNLQEKPSTLPEKQALASIGQAHLIETYEELFSLFNMKCSQILVNHEDFDHRDRLMNLSLTMNSLLKYDVVPIINENDALSTQEIKFGDNDTLAALFVPVIDAQLLILVSDIDGLYTDNPHTNKEAKLIDYVEVIDETILSYAGETSSYVGTGGMVTKLKAAMNVNAYGASMCIVNGQKPFSIQKALYNEGTWFNGNKEKLNSRKHWLAYRVKSKGQLFVDEGCQKALCSHHSLLPRGITKVIGEFLKGQVVDIVNAKHEIIGKGIVNYSAKEIDLIKGHQSHQIESILKYKDYDEIIHINNMYIKEDFYDNQGHC